MKYNYTITVRLVDVPIWYNGITSLRASEASARGALGRWVVEVGSRKDEYLTADRNSIRREGRGDSKGLA